MDAWEVAPDVFCLGPSGRTQTNVYFVRSDAGWFLVDAGWQSDRARIAQAAVQLFGVGSRPENILLTHCHPDHAGAALDLARGWDREVLMHPAELPIATGDFEAMRAFAGPLDRWVVLPIMRAMGGGGVKPCCPGPAWVRSLARSIRAARSQDYPAGSACPRRDTRRVTWPSTGPPTGSSSAAMPS